MNGNETGTKPQTARDMTAEIDRAADLMIEQQREATLKRGEMTPGTVANSVESGFEQPDRFDRGQAGNLGNKILTYNPEAQMNTERVREIVASENGENSGGNGESKELIKEREAWNKENLLNELDPKRDFEAQIMAKDQMGIGREMSVAVEEKTKSDNFNIMDLVIMKSKGRDRMLESFENPRRLGDMN